MKSAHSLVTVRIRRPLIRLQRQFATTSYVDGFVGAVGNTPLVRVVILLQLTFQQEIH